MLPSIFDFGQHISNFGSKIFNNDLDVSHFLYNIGPYLSILGHAESEKGHRC